MLEVKYKKYLVGGAVRNELLNLPVQERDIVVVGATSEIMLSEGYKQVGKDFPVFLHPISHEEHALARTERKSGKGHTGFICYSTPEVTIEEDLSRRDLTINAIAKNEEGKLIDPYNGCQDISNRLLRHISNSFSEDPLRVLRVARFAAYFAHLNFRIALETMKLMKKMKKELLLISPERIWNETKKALLTKSPQIYFKVLRDCGALKLLFPEIEDLFKVSFLNNEYEYINTGDYTLIMLSMAAKLSDNISVRFATLCYNLGKSKIIKNKKKLIYHNNELSSLTCIDKLCFRLRVPNNLQTLAKIVSKYSNLLNNSLIFSTNVIMQLFNAIDVWRRPERLEYIIIVNTADFYVRTRCENHLYPQGDFLRNAYKIVRSVNTKLIIKKNIYGKDISIELHKLRQKALEDWKNNQ